MCAKIAWPSIGHALAELAWCTTKREWGEERRREGRAYRCPRCGGWHLTSRETP
jgi:hypothetical protein